MDKIKDILHQLYMDTNTDEYTEVFEKIDNVLNLIESTNTHDLVGCNIAIKRMKKIIGE